jgi:lysophospholipase L1-like esterase
MKGMVIKMKTVLCFGDSNTHGTKPIDFDLLGTLFIAANYRYDKADRWTGVMEKELGQEYLVIEEGLNGRTTVWDDSVEGIHKNGSRYLPACLESHAPLDLVIIMLGTNDLKTRFCVNAFEIAMSLGVLVNMVQQSGSGPQGNTPEVLIMCPPPLGRLNYLSEIFNENSIHNSKILALHYEKIAKLYNCHFLDTAKIIRTSEADGVHYEKGELEKLGKKAAQAVKKIIG